MIVKFLSTLTSANSAIEYVENDQHISDVIATSNDLPVRKQGQEHRLAALQAVGVDALDALVAYADDSAKTLDRQRQITDEAKEMMRARGALKPKTKDAWMHVVISYHPSDRPRVTDADMAADSKALVLAMADEENVWRARRGRSSRVDGDSLLWVSTVHREKKHIHVHLILCRIDEDGNLLSNSGHRNVEAARKLCTRIEEERGYVRTKAWPEDDERPDQWYKRGDHAPEQSELAEEIAGIADAAADRDDLTQRLDERGLRLERVVNGRGYNLVDSAGTSVQASRFGLVGRRNPDRIGAPPSPKTTARTDLWTAAEESADWPSFADALHKRGLHADTTEAGVVRRFQRVNERGAPIKGAHWSPRELGFSRPPRKGDSVWWQRRKEQAARLGERGGPSTRRASTKGNQKTGQQGQAKTDRTTGVILLPAAGKSWHDALVDLAQQREGLAAKIAARERAVFEAKQQAEAAQTQVAAPEEPAPVAQPTVSPALSSTPAATATPGITAWERERFQKDVASVQDMLVKLRSGRERDLATQRRMLMSRGISLSFDERTSSWYANRDGQVAAVPGLSGVADDGRGKDLAPVQAPVVPSVVPTAKPKEKPTVPRSVPGVDAVKRAAKKLPKRPDGGEGGERKKLPDQGP